MLSFNTRAGRAMLALSLAALHACATESAPVGPIVDGELARASAVTGRVDNAAVYWNGVARDMVVSTLASTPFAIRGYAVMSVAQYQAAVAAEQGRDRSTHPSVHAAISGASVAVLAYLFPAEAEPLEAKLADYLALPAVPGEQRMDTQAGVAIGRMIGEQLVMRAQTDNFFAPWTGTVPVGPGIWFSSTVPPTPPGGAAFGQAKTFLLASADQFRPPAPPAFDSPEFLSGLHEVRAFSDGRTAAQDSIAKFWHLPPGTYAPPGYWNEEAANLAVKYRLGEREAAYVLALTNMVIYDCLVASHEAKFTYWLLRPTQADPGIQLSVGLPNFPSYPSNHAALSAGAAKILGYAFPAERARLNARAEEAALSRVLGGIHYRFDGDAGMELGRRIADWAMQHDVKGHRALVLR